MPQQPQFDPYHEWLAIPPDSRPPTHYQLLGIAPSESSQQIIDTATLRQSAFLRTLQKGEHAEFANQILTEISQARAVLSDPVQRKKYDESLRAKSELKSKSAPKASNVDSRSKLEADRNVEIVKVARPADGGSYQVTNPRSKPSTRASASASSRSANARTAAPERRHTMTLILALVGIVFVAGVGIVVVRSLGRNADADQRQASSATLSDDTERNDRSKVTPQTKPPVESSKPTTEQRQPDRPQSQASPSPPKDIAKVNPPVVTKSKEPEPAKPKVEAKPIDPEAWWNAVPLVGASSSSQVVPTNLIVSNSRQLKAMTFYVPLRPNDNVENEVMIEEAIQLLGSDDESVVAALKQLANCEPNHRVADVMELLERKLKDKTHSRDAIAAIANWDPESAIAHLEAESSKTREKHEREANAKELSRLRDQSTKRTTPVPFPVMQTNRSKSPPSLKLNFDFNTKYVYTAVCAGALPETHGTETFDISVWPFQFEKSLIGFKMEHKHQTEVSRRNGRSGGGSGGGGGERAFETDVFGKRIARPAPGFWTRHVTQETSPIIWTPHYMLVLPLPPGPVNEWEFTRSCTYSSEVAQMESQFRGQVRGGGQRHRMGDDYPSDIEEKYLFRIANRTETELRVNFDYSVTPKSRSKSGVEYHAKGRGNYRFDFVSGVITNITLDCEESESFPGGSRSRLIAVVVRLLSTEGASDFTVPTGATVPTCPAITDELFAKSLKALSSEDADERKQGILAFYKFPPNAKREVAVQTLKASLEKLEGTQRFWCLSAIGSWGGKSAVQFLSPYLEKKDTDLRFGAAEGLVRTGDPQAIEPILKLLPSKNSGSLIAKYLMRSGPFAEPKIIPLLGNSNELVRIRACEILGMIGTGACLEHLRAMTGETEKAAARAAADRIQSRKT